MDLTDPIPWLITAFCAGKVAGMVVGAFLTNRKQTVVLKIVRDPKPKA